jgi:GT2 family glycosyltransferase
MPYSADIPTATPLVSIVTVNYRQLELTCGLLDSVCQIDYPCYELIVVDNGASVDNSARYAQHLPDVQVINSAKNLGFAGGNNLGIARARGQYILLINNDTIVPPDLLSRLVEVLEADVRIGIVSPKIYYHEQPDVLQYAGSRGINPFTGRGKNLARQRTDDGSFDRIGPTDLAHGACMMVRRQLFEEIGLLPEDYFLYYEEIDFCERARRQGWQIYLAGHAYIHHRESASVGSATPLKTYYLYRNRWLYMRRFYRGLPYWSFVVYFLVAGVPLNVLRHSLKGEWRHVQAILRSLAWNLSNTTTPAL